VGSGSRPLEQFGGGHGPRQADDDGLNRSSSRGLGVTPQSSRERDGRTVRISRARLRGCASAIAAWGLAGVWGDSGGRELTGDERWGGGDPGAATYGAWCEEREQAAEV
jgi:hypothetical protein